MTSSTRNRPARRIHHPSTVAMRLPPVSPVIRWSMAECESVTVRDLRNHGGRVLDEVSRGSTVVVTRDGTPVAEMRPVRRVGLSAAELIARRRALPYLDYAKLRRDVDTAVEMSL